MKLLFSVFLVVLTHSANASASFDGCYQLITSQNQTVARFCLSGTTEEGINGSGIRMALFGAFSDNLLQCELSTAAKMTENSFDFVLDSHTQLAMSKAERKNGMLEGYAQVGSSAFLFAELEEETSARLQQKANRSAICRN